MGLLDSLFGKDKDSILGIEKDSVPEKDTDALPVSDKVRLSSGAKNDFNVAKDEVTFCKNCKFCEKDHRWLNLSDKDPTNFVCTAITRERAKEYVLDSPLYKRMEEIDGFDGTDTEPHPPCVKVRKQDHCKLYAAKR
jgi:hypothetical protein